MNDAQMHQRNEFNDEISLVDLAVTFVRRRRVFYAVFTVCVLAGVAYALIADTTYRYTSLIQGAATDSNEPLVSPEVVMSGLEGRWLPEVRATYEAEHGKLPFEVTFDNPEKTNIIKLASEASEDRANMVEHIHQTLMADVTKEQGSLLEEQKNQLEQQITAVGKLIQSLQEEGATGETVAGAVERKLNLELELASLKPAKTLVVARQSADATGPKRVLIVVLAIVLGGMLGVFAAFLTEFFVAVRAQMARQH
ncbi:lipopolysaccharide biosynthesis protein [Marinobacter halodurans]|uniref:Lipopolysaccharide biosynthesis protein n=1 Tax=Marinobacter halodurans TaxID=2528979 RepID=A0ABY1ZNL3_9GAMM|nr:Wzz/FepE/Etk N-terminal domain-containing protein [Marinobacter halodurans]TBW56709.1 lipopolysaccharide biosynthesis protein [Marinobacter halodurans]